MAMVVTLPLVVADFVLRMLLERYVAVILAFTYSEPEVDVVA